MATLKVCTGFEHGVSDLTSLTKGNTGVKLFDSAAGSPTMQSSAPVRTGTYALELNPAAGTEYVGWTTGTLGSSQTVLVASLWIRFPSALPSNDCTIVYLTSTASIDTKISFRNSDDKLIVEAHDGSATVAVGPVVAADTWYLIDFRYNVSAATHTVEWEVDGSAQPQFNGNSSAGSVTEFSLGDRFNANTMTCRYDDVLASTTSADYPLGGHKVLLLKPDTGGTTTEFGTANRTARFTANATADATHNSANILTALSEVPPLIGATATGVCQRVVSSVADTDGVGIPMTTYTLSGGETISGLRLLIVGWSGSATANSLGIKTYNGTTLTGLQAGFTYDPNFDNSTTSAAWYCQMLTLAEYDTQTELDAWQVRLGYSDDISPLPGAHAVYGELAVKEASGGATATLDQATETDSATSPTFTKTATLGQSTETDSSLGATLAKAKPLGQATETDVAQPLTVAKVATLGLPAETDTALGVTATKVVTLGLATETDQAFEAAFGATLDFALSLATETDTSQSLTVSKAATEGLATEVDSSASVSFTKTVVLGLATETGEALTAAFGEAASFTLSLATETNSAQSLTAARAVTLSLAAEADAVATATLVKVLGLGLATETDEAFALESGDPVGTASPATFPVPGSFAATGAASTSAAGAGTAPGAAGAVATAPTAAAATMTTPTATGA